MSVYKQGVRDVFVSFMAYDDSRKIRQHFLSDSRFADEVAREMACNIMRIIRRKDEDVVAYDMAGNPIAKIPRNDEDEFNSVVANRILARLPRREDDLVELGFDLYRLIDEEALIERLKSEGTLEDVRSLPDRLYTPRLVSALSNFIFEGSGANSQS